MNTSLQQRLNTLETKLLKQEHDFQQEKQQMLSQHQSEIKSISAQIHAELKEQSETYQKTLQVESEGQSNLREQLLQQTQQIYLLQQELASFFERRATSQTPISVSLSFDASRLLSLTLFLFCSSIRLRNSGQRFALTNCKSTSFRKMQSKEKK
jgi:hypothetical protein